MAPTLWARFVAFLNRHVHERDVDELKEGGMLYLTGERRARAQLLEAQTAAALADTILKFDSVVLVTGSHIAIKHGSLAGVRPLTPAEREDHRRGLLGRLGEDPEQAREFFLGGMDESRPALRPRQSEAGSQDAH